MKKHLVVYTAILLIASISYGYAGWDDPVLHSGSDVTLTGTSTINGVVVQTETLDAATGNEVAYQLNYTTNKASSGNDTGLEINMTDTASPGTSYGINYTVGGASKFSVSNTGTITTAAGLSLAGDITEVIADVNGLDIQGGVSATLADAFGATFSRASTYSQSSGRGGAVQIRPTYNQTSTAGADDLRINRTETAVGSGTQRLISAGTGGASYVEGFGVGRDGSVRGTRSKAAITDNTATGIFTITTPASGYCGVTVEYTATSTNATDFQSNHGLFTFTTVNKAGVTSCDESAAVGESTVASSGTLTAAAACADTATSPDTINFTFDSSLNSTSTMYYQVRVNGTEGCLITPL